MSNNTRFDSKDYYPPYYKEVFIEYCPADGDRCVITKAWLAVDDNDNLVWTLVDSDEVIADKQVVNWTDFGI